MEHAYNKDKMRSIILKLFCFHQGTFAAIQECDFFRKAPQRKNRRRDLFYLELRLTRSHFTTLASQEKNSRSQSDRSFHGFDSLVGGGDVARQQLRFAGGKVFAWLSPGCSSSIALEFALISLKQRLNISTSTQRGSHCVLLCQYAHFVLQFLISKMLWDCRTALNAEENSKKLQSVKRITFVGCGCVKWNNIY